MANNLIPPYAADICANLYKKKKGQAFSIDDIPNNVKKSSLKNNKIIEKVKGTGKQYRFTPQGVNVLRRRGLI